MAERRAKCPVHAGVLSFFSQKAATSWDFKNFHRHWVRCTTSGNVEKQYYQAIQTIRLRCEDGCWNKSERSCARRMEATYKTPVSPHFFIKSSRDPSMRRCYLLRMESHANTTPARIACVVRWVIVCELSHNDPTG
jgi:hypothetical protein